MLICKWNIGCHVVSNRLYILVI